jgi:hypothetical protein
MRKLAYKEELELQAERFRQKGQWEKQEDKRYLDGALERQRR